MDHSSLCVYFLTLAIPEGGMGHRNWREQQELPILEPLTPWAVSPA